MPSYAIWIYGRSNLRLVLYISLSLDSNTYKIISRLYLTRDSVSFFFFFELVKVYYKSNKVEEHLNMIVTI